MTLKELERCRKELEALVKCLQQHQSLKARRHIHRKAIDIFKKIEKGVVDE